MGQSARIIRIQGRMVDNGGGIMSGIHNHGMHAQRFTTACGLVWTLKKLVIKVTSFIYFVLRKLVRWLVRKITRKNRVGIFNVVSQLMSRLLERVTIFWFGKRH